MRRVLCLAMALALATTLLTAADPEAVPKNRSTAQKPPPGVEAAQTLSTLTGVAISPLLGVGAVGAWKYYRATPETRSRLPWFARPWFWMPALAVVLLVFLKDTLGTSVPTVLKKPLDLLELFENKVSAVVAAGLFVPFITSIFQSVGETSQLGGLGLGMIDPALLFNLMLLPLALTAFLVVFLASHAINVLILLSPFATVDMALKSFRMFLLATVMATSLANAYFGAIWAGVLIVVSYFIAGWSLRMTVFGTVLAWDILTFRQRRFQPNPKENWAFTAHKLGKVPVRTYGRLRRDEAGKLILAYRPWMVLPERELTVPQGDYSISRGLFYPEVHAVTGQETRAVFLLPPSCRGHENRFQDYYQFGPTRDTKLLRGIKGLKEWLRDFWNFGRKQPATAEFAS